MYKKKYCLFLFSMMFLSCFSQSSVLSKNKNIKKENDLFAFIEGVFIRPGVGYQGPNQTEIDALPRFRVGSGEGDFTKTLNNTIAKASKSKTNGKLGAVVIIEKGNYILGTINLKSNVHLRIEEGVILQADQTDPKKIKVTKLVFNIGKDENIENVSIIGRGTEKTRPVIRYKRESPDPKTGGVRAFLLGAAKNVFIQNVTIQDDQTRFSGVVFSFLHKDTSDSGRANGVTVDHVSQINASYGYGLIQANAGKNLLFTNLICSGGVCARIETDNRSSQSKFGIENVVIENVTSIKGKAAVFLQPHNISNGDVYVNGAHGIESQMAVEIRPGYKDYEGSGRFGTNSSIKNVTAVYSMNSVVSKASKSALPQCLLKYFKKDPTLDSEKQEGVGLGPSVCAIGDFTQQIKININTVSASIIEGETNPDNSLEARKLIVNGPAYRGDNLTKQCGIAAYE